MNGLEILEKIQNQGDDFEQYAEHKLATIYNQLCALIAEQEAHGKYTDAGHSNCISQMKSIIGELKKDACPNEEDQGMN